MEEDRWLWLVKSVWERTGWSMERGAVSHVVIKGVQRGVVARGLELF